MTRRSGPRGAAPQTSAKKSTAHSTNQVRQRGGPFRYECSAQNPHLIVSPWELFECPAFRLGRPCLADVTLKAKGDAARTSIQ